MISTMTSFKILLPLAVFTVLLGASDISGKWSGSAVVKTPDGETITYEIQAQFLQKGEAVSGTIGRTSEELAIRNVQIRGTKLSFEVAPPETVDAVKFQLERRGERLEGELKGEVDGGPVSGKVTLSR
jgi:hypothetical protein